MNFNSDNIKNDPRYLEAKKLLKDLIEEKTSTINHIKKSDKNHSKTETLIKTFGKIRGGNLFFPYISSGFGNGSLVQLHDGSIKYDMINGIGVHPGHQLDLFLKHPYFQASKTPSCKEIYNKMKVVFFYVSN